MAKGKSFKKNKTSLSPMEQKLQKAFGASVTSTVNVEMKMGNSVSEFLRAMDKGKDRVSRCKMSFGD